MCDAITQTMSNAGPRHRIGGTAMPRWVCRAPRAWLRWVDANRRWVADRLVTVARERHAGHGAPSTPATAATWTRAWYVLVNRNSGKALDVYNLATTDGARITQWTP